MTPETRDVLSRYYGYAKGALKRLGDPKPAELKAAAAEGYKPGRLEKPKHDELVRRMREACARLDERTILSAFVAGVGGSWLRGRQPLVSYAFARHLEEHTADPTPGYDHCRTCGIPVKAEIEVADTIVRWHLGSVWNEGHEEYALDLEEMLTLEPPAPTAADRAVLHAVLRAAAESPPACTPGELEKELARRKLIPDGSKYGRYGILEALAEVGVLPNPLVAPSWDRFVTQAERWDASKKSKGSARSDIVLPFGAWRGALGVDWKRAKKLFGIGR
ncbi:MAG: hypothetical protein IT379_35740 [Deltaproteobacteria bacterium]|nr:hypothetical protein [Deltaproteobacteria bacterium]